MIRRTMLLIPLLIAPIGFVGASGWTAHGAQEESPMGEAMGVLKKEQRSLRKLIADPAANEEAILTSLRKMERATLTAIAEAPPHPEALSGKKLALYNVGYRQTMATMLGTLLNMQKAALGGDGAALKKGYDELNASKEAGHQEYRDFE